MNDTTTQTPTHTPTFMVHFVFDFLPIVWVPEQTPTPTRTLLPSQTATSPISTITPTDDSIPDLCMAGYIPDEPADGFILLDMVPVIGTLFPAEDTDTYKFEVEAGLPGYYFITIIDRTAAVSPGTYHDVGMDIYFPDGALVFADRDQYSVNSPQNPNHPWVGLWTIVVNNRNSQIETGCYVLTLDVRTFQ